MATPDRRGHPAPGEIHQDQNSPDYSAFVETINNREITIRKIHQKNPGIIRLHRRFLQAATEQDKSIGKEFVIEIHCGDLVLRDMGYFSLNELTEIEQRQARWLTRLPLTTSVLLADGRTLKKYLKSCCKDAIDLDVIVGKQGKKCRPVAMLAAPEITAARWAERRKKGRDLAELITFYPDPRHVSRDMRTRKSPVESGISALT